MNTHKLKWIVIDVGTGKLDGYYLRKEDAQAVAQDFAAEHPERGVLVAKVEERIGPCAITRKRSIFTPEGARAWDA